jgi:hypothetical protein
MKSLLILSSVFLFTSCAHKMMRGTVAMKTDNKTAHVCLGNNDVEIGDKLDFYTNSCKGSAGAKDNADTRECKLKVLGTGTVTKLLNSHYSEVTTEDEFAFNEGTLVQKKQ